MSGSDNTLMLAILALDSYNRDYNAQLIVPGNTIGDATFSPVEQPANAFDVGFYASA